MMPHLPSVAAPIDGFPLGEPILYVRYFADTRDRAISATVENAYSQQLAMLRPANELGVLDRGRDDWFVLVGPTGMPLQHLHYTASMKGVAIGVHDGQGRKFGDLVQTRRNGMLQHTLPMAVLIDGRQWAATEVGRMQPAEELPAPIVDGNGAALATVWRQWRYQGGNFKYDPRFYDYKLDCPAVASGQLPAMILAVALSHYITDRLRVGGPLNYLAIGANTPGRMQ